MSRNSVATCICVGEWLLGMSCWILGVILQAEVLAGWILLHGSTCLKGRVSGVHIALAPLNVHSMTCNELFSHFTHPFDIIMILR